MEGREILVSPINAIYTRSINDPIAALRLTGRLGRTSIGFITAYDEHTPWIVPFRDYSFPVASDRNSFSNILRIRQSILKDSYIGFLATSRDMKESYSRVAGFDGNVRFLKNYNITFQGLRSWNREPNDTSIFPGREWLQFDDYTSAFDGEKFDGTTYRIRFERTARLWSFTIWHNARSPGFRADNGFIRWNDVRNIGLWTRLDFEPHKWIFERITPLLSIWRRYDYAGNFRKEFIHPGLSITFPRQTNASLTYSLSSEVFMGEKFENIWTVDGSLNTNFSKFISGNVWGQVGKGINYFASPVSLGDIRNISLHLTLINPIPRLLSCFSASRYWLWESDGGEEVYDVTVFRNSTSYQIMKHLSIGLITQYHSASKNIAIYPLLSYEPTPFTVFYLGSNHDLNKFNEPYGYRESDRHIFVKFQYLFDY